MRLRGGDDRAIVGVVDGVVAAEEVLLRFMVVGVTCDGGKRRKALQKLLRGGGSSMETSIATAAPCASLPDTGAEGALSCAGGAPVSPLACAPSVLGRLGVNCSFLGASFASVEGMCVRACMTAVVLPVLEASFASVGGMCAADSEGCVGGPMSSPPPDIATQARVKPPAARGSSTHADPPSAAVFT